MRTMAQVLAEKGTHVWWITPDATVFEALQLMAQKDVGALVVMDGGRPVGLLSERDYARKVILMRRSSLDTPVSSIMTRALVSAPPHWSVEATMALMTDRRTRHVLITENGAIAGIVSIGDLVKATIEDQQFVIAQLEQYVSS